MISYLLRVLIIIALSSITKTFAPDGRSSGMGDVGAASTPDINSQHWNAAKYAFLMGKEAPGSVILGMFQSLYDAPGVRRSDGSYSVAAEEIHELLFGLGAEYYFRKVFAVRTGYFHEHQTKGNRKYLMVCSISHDRNFRPYSGFFQIGTPDNLKSLHPAPP